MLSSPNVPVYSIPAFMIVIFKVEFSKVVAVVGIPFAPWSGLSIVDFNSPLSAVTLNTTLNWVP